MDEIAGARRNYEDGYTIANSPLKVRIYKDCIVLGATNTAGLAMLNSPRLLGILDEYNLGVSRDCFGEIHTIEILSECPVEGIG